MKEFLPSDAQELFKSRIGAVYQSAGTRRFLLEYKGTVQSFSAQHFFQLKNHLSSINLEELLESHSLCDTEVLYLPGMDILLVMRIHEILGLRELFEAATAMQELNSILYQRIYNVLI